LAFVIRELYDGWKTVASVQPKAIENNGSFFSLISPFTLNQNTHTTVLVSPAPLIPGSQEFQATVCMCICHVKGEISEKKDPLFSIAFGCTDATVFHPSYNSRITKANLEGSFATPSFSSLADARLFLKK